MNERLEVFCKNEALVRRLMEVNRERILTFAKEELRPLRARVLVTHGMQGTRQHRRTAEELHKNTTNQRSMTRYALISETVVGTYHTNVRIRVFLLN